MRKQYLSLPVQYTTSTELQEDDIKIPVQILVMHDQINLNQSNFDFEVIDNEETKESIKNIPILGYIKKIDGSDSKDFAGHEMEVTFKDGDINITYLERPIGVVPESNQYEYVEKDGKKYVKVIGYLWKDYMNDGYEILQENPQKSVSMEICVDSYEVRKDGIVDIKAYRYTGITILGDNVQPAMSGANLQVIDQFSENENQKFSQEFYERVEKLNFELRNIANTPLEGGDITQMTKEKEGENMDNTEQLSFSATYRQKREALNNALDPIITKDNNNNIIEETYYWINDFDDEYVYVERDHWTENNYESDNGRYTYTFDQTTLTATITSQFEKMVLTWLTETENQQIQDERNNFTAKIELLETKVSEYESKFTEYETNVNSLTEENESLKVVNEELNTYKLNKEKDSHVESLNKVFSKFEKELKDNQDYIDYKEQVQSDVLKYNVEQVDEKLLAIYGKTQLNKNNKTPKENFSAPVIEDDVEEIPSSRYGDLDRFLNK